MLHIFFLVYVHSTQSLKIIDLISYEFCFSGNFVLFLGCLGVCVCVRLCARTRVCFKTKLLINTEKYLLCKNRKTQRRIKTVIERTGIRKRAKDRSTDKLCTDCELRKANAMQRQQNTEKYNEKKDSVGDR